MYKVSEALANTLAGNSRCMRAKLVCGSEVIDSGIQSIKLVQQANADNETVSIGGAVSAYAEISIYKPLRLVTRKEYTLYIGAVLPDDTVEYCKMGLFTPKKPQEDDGLLTFKAYDRMVSRLWKAYFPTVSKYPADGKEILADISKQCGIAIANLSSLPAGVTVSWGTAYNEDGSAMKVPPFTACTIREALSYLAQMYGAFATINRDGEIEFRWYEATSYEVPANRSFDDIVCAEQVYKLQGISCTVNDKTIMAGTVSSIQIENSYMTQSILNSVYKKIGGFSFLPTTFSFLGDPRLDLGDIITVYRRDGTAIKVPVMSITFDFDGGLSTEVGSYGSDVEEGEDQVKGPTTKALERVYTDLFLVRQVVADKVSVNYLEANYATITELDAVSARIDKIVTSEVTVEYLEANYAKMKDVEANFATIDLANVKDASIKSAMIDEGAVKTVQIADGSITDAKIVELTANKITAGTLSVERLELVGSTSSIVYALNNSGELVSKNVNTLDGDVLTDRTITADKLVANSITANEIASKTITANEILANTITSAELAAGSVTADILAAGSVTAEKISVTDLSALNATIGGFTIGDKYLANGTTTLGTTEKSVYVGLDGISCGKNFIAKADGTVRIQGDVYCNNNIYMYSGYNQQYFSVLQYVVDSGEVSELYLHAPNGETILHWSQEISGFSIENISCSDLYVSKSVSASSITASNNLIAPTISITGQGLEIVSPTPFIDFHRGSSTADYTTRIQPVNYYGSYGLQLTGENTFYTTGYIIGAGPYIEGNNFFQSGRGYAMCGHNQASTYHCYWTGNALQFQVDVTWVWSTSDKRLKKNIVSIKDDYIDAVGTVDLIQYNLNRKGYSDKEIYFGAIAQDISERLTERGLSDEGLKLLQKQKATEDDETLYYSMDYEQFLLLRIAYDEKKIRQMQEEIEALKHA